MNNEETRKDRLKKFIREQELSIRAFERLCGLSRGYVLSCKEISQKMVNKINIVYPQLNPSWVLKGEGDMLMKEMEEAKKNHESENVIYSLKSEILKLEAQLELYKQLYKETSEQESQLREKFGATNKELEMVKKDYRELEQEYSSVRKEKEVS